MLREKYELSFLRLSADVQWPARLLFQVTLASPGLTPLNCHVKPRYFTQDVLLLPLLSFSLSPSSVVLQLASFRQLAAIISPQCHVHETWDVASRLWNFGNDIEGREKELFSSFDVLFDPLYNFLSRRIIIFLSRFISLYLILAAAEMSGRGRWWLGKLAKFSTHSSDKENNERNSFQRARWNNKGGKQEGRKLYTFR